MTGTFQKVKRSREVTNVPTYIHTYGEDTFSKMGRCDLHKSLEALFYYWRPFQIHWVCTLLTSQILNKISKKRNREGEETRQLSIGKENMIAYGWAWLAPKKVHDDDDDTVQTFTLLQIGCWCYGFHNEQPLQKRKPTTIARRRNILRRMQLRMLSKTSLQSEDYLESPSLRINFFLLGPIDIHTR